MYKQYIKKGDCVTMELKEQFIGNVITTMSTDLNNEQLQNLRNCLITLFCENDLVSHKELPSDEVVDNSYILKHFFATKKMTGLSDKTLKMYYYHINKFLEEVKRNVLDINTNHIRRYLAKIGINNSNSYVDDIRRILNSFFTFCENEEYVSKNPCKKIEKIKQKKQVKTAYNDTEIELLREACKTKRELALIDFLLSTDCRRDEIRQIKISDINFQERTVLIHGKGNKDRTVCYSARCELHLKEYLKTRKFASEYLFCAEKKPFNQLTNAGLACIVKRIGEKTNVENVHLHRFRRTFATNLLKRGMPIEQVKTLLGHIKIETTLIYCNIENDNVIHSYTKYM